MPLVDTREVQLGGLIESRRVNDLPLNGRNVYQLVTTLPGVSSARLATGPDDTGNYMNVNGSRSRQSTFFLDGNMNNSHFRNSGNEAPNPDAVEEFRLITSNFNAEFGRSSGAVVNVVTHSGTNQFHGTAFEFLRNNHPERPQLLCADGSAAAPEPVRRQLWRSHHARPAVLLRLVSGAAGPLQRISERRADADSRRTAGRFLRRSGQPATQRSADRSAVPGRDHPADAAGPGGFEDPGADGAAAQHARRQV